MKEFGNKNWATGKRSSAGGTPQGGAIKKVLGDGDWSVI